MSVAEIKETKSNLIAWIEGLSDVNLLNALDGLRTANTSKDWWDDLTENQKQYLEEGLKEAENGDVYSSEIFWQRLKNG
jgi:hypothetical protein